MNCSARRTSQEVITGNAENLSRRWKRSPGFPDEIHKNFPAPGLFKLIFWLLTSLRIRHPLNLLSVIQISLLRWLSTPTTASYSRLVHPCCHRQIRANRADVSSAKPAVKSAVGICKGAQRSFQGFRGIAGHLLLYRLLMSRIDFSYNVSAEPI